MIAGDASGFLRGFMAGFGCVFLLGVLTPLQGFVAPRYSGHFQHQERPLIVSPVDREESTGFTGDQRTLALTAVNALAALAVYATMGKRRKNSSFAMVSGTRVVPVVQPPIAPSNVTCKALDQSSRYADLGWQRKTSSKTETMCLWLTS